MVRNPPYLTTFPNKSHKGTTFYKTAGEKADKKWDCPGAECHLYYQRLRAEVAFSPLSQICVHFHANVCAFSRKRLRPRFQTFALAVSNVCVHGFKRLRPDRPKIRYGGLSCSFWPDRCRGGMLFPVPLIQTSLQQIFLIAPNLMCEESRGCC